MQVSMYKVFLVLNRQLSVWIFMKEGVRDLEIICVFFQSPKVNTFSYR